MYQYSYSPRGEVVDMTYPSLNNEEWSYGANGDVTGRYLDIPGHEIPYTYDDAGRLTGIDYPTGTDTSFAYDAADRLVEMIDASGTTEWEYNDADELTQLTTPQGVVNYVYKLDGQPEKIQQPSMNDLVYRYDTYGRVDRITSAFNEVTDILYDNLGSRVERKNLPNGTHELYEYDVRGRVEEITLKKNNDVLRALEYTYNEVDNIEQIVETRESTITKTYDYDAIDQLIEETWSTGYSAEYEYDENGNRTKRMVGSTVEDYFYGDDDELTEIKIGSTVVKSFGYDGAGRRTSATFSGVTTNYAYDYESRITSITRTGVTANSFAYNGLDTRVSKTDSAGTTSYKRAGAYVTDSLLKSTVSSTTTDYTPGVSSRVGSDSTFLHSGIKNADTQTDDGGDVSAMRHYDAFGNLVSSSQTWQEPFGYGGPYGYQTDPDHGLMFLGHRYYEADTGRFLTRDPIKDGRNWYGYCGNDPVNSADPSGLRQSESYIQDVGQVFAGYGDAIGQFLISTTPYGQFKTWRRAMEVGPREMLSDFIDGFKFWDTDDPREFGRRFGNGLLLIAPGVKQVPSPRMYPKSSGTLAGLPVKQGSLQKGDLLHNAPNLLADIVRRKGEITVRNGRYIQRELPGIVNGKEGTFEFGYEVRPVGKPLVTHWLFKRK